MNLSPYDARPIEWNERLLDIFPKSSFLMEVNFSQKTMEVKLDDVAQRMPSGLEGNSLDLGPSILVLTDH